MHYPTELHQHARLLTHQVFNHPPSITTGALKNCYYSMDRDHRTTHHVSSASPGTTAAGPLLSYHYSTDWGAGTSQHTSSSQVVGIATALGLGLILCSSSKGMHRNCGLVNLQTYKLSCPLLLISEDERRFIVAAKEGDVSTLKHLLDSGVDVNCRHPLGWTALHTAVINGHKRYIATNVMSTLQ